jgi:hypothetical protein
MPYESLEDNAIATFRKSGYYGVSAFSLPGLTADEIAVAVGTRWLPHGQLRKSSVLRLRAAGFDELIPVPPPDGHIDIKVEAPTESVLSMLALLFDSPQPNPVARGRTSG